jgi:hypothetical protein
VEDHATIPEPTLLQFGQLHVSIFTRHPKQHIDILSLPLLDGDQRNVRTIDLSFGVEGVEIERVA